MIAPRCSARPGRQLAARFPLGPICALLWPATFCNAPGAGAAINRGRAGADTRHLTRCCVQRSTLRAWRFKSPRRPPSLSGADHSLPPDTGAAGGCGGTLCQASVVVAPDRSSAPLLLFGGTTAARGALSTMALLDRDQLFRRLRGKQDNKVGEPAGRAGWPAVCLYLMNGQGARGAGLSAAAAGHSPPASTSEDPNRASLAAGQRDRQPAKGRRIAA